MIKKKILQFSLMAAALIPAVSVAETILFQGVASTGQSEYAILEAQPDGSALYAINNSATPGVERFTVNADGSLNSDFAVSSSQAGLEGATSVAFSPRADVLLLGNNSAGARLGLYAFSVGDSGNGFDELEFANSNGGATEAGLFDDINVSSVAVSPDGNNIYVTGTEIISGEGVIAVLGGIRYLPSLNRVEYTPLLAGARILESDSAALAALDTPVDIAATEAGVYVISSSTTVDDALIYFIRNKDTGTLTFNSLASNATGISQLQDPADLLVATIDDASNIFIADKASNTIIQFRQAEASAAPSLQRIYGKLGDNGQTDVPGLTGVSRMVMNSHRTVLHTAATASSTITSFYVDSGLLVRAPDKTSITQGLQTSSGVTIAGIAGVNLLALGRGNEYLYAAGSVSTTPGLARFTRQAGLSLAVTSVNRSFIQPGQLAAFSVVLTNNGPADAPNFLLLLTPSHSVTDITISSDSNDLGACELTSSSGAGSIVCKGAILANGADFSVNVSMRPTRVTTASVTAQAASGNEASSAIISASDSIIVGEAKNGTLATGLLAHLLLLAMYMIRRFTPAR